VSDTAVIEAPVVDNPCLDDWLRRQESLNPRLMDLGLDRCAAVAGPMGLSELPMPVATVAGTNGKGSCVAYLTGILESAGYAVAAYTSPYLLRYNESLRIRGREVGDDVLVAAFERVEGCRGDVPLTFFEFRTLAALDIISRSRVDVAVLEIGLGGRLDAVNIVDADVAVVTSIDLDHMDWLGPDRDSIGREKAGIFRPGRPAVCGDGDPPGSLVDHGAALGVELKRIGVDYTRCGVGGGWSWRGDGVEYANLPWPGMGGEFQLDNAATAIMAARMLGPAFDIGEAAVRDGSAGAWLPARQQIFPGPVERIVDVAHNAQAAGALAGALAARPRTGRTHGVLAMLADKDVSAVAGALAGQVDAWHTATLPGPRGGDGEDVARALNGLFPGQPVTAHPDVVTAWRSALAGASDGDRIVGFGSFLTAREILVIEGLGR
jgi:dihydrofolate synthase/folylpolyglutamate synthase